MAFGKDFSFLYFLDLFGYENDIQKLNLASYLFAL